MAHPTDTTLSQTFVIRVRRDRQALRGQVVAVATGEARLFEDLADAMAFIRAQVEEGQGETARPPAATPTGRGSEHGT